MFIEITLLYSYKIILSGSSNELVHLIQKQIQELLSAGNFNKRAYSKITLVTVILYRYFKD